MNPWFDELRSQLGEWTGDYEKARTMIRLASRVFFVGNGGSAAIASHMAIDYMKNGGKTALAFNDTAALTCVANDLGYAEVFAFAIEHHARTDDLLIAISSSGRSDNILAAAAAAARKGCSVMTLSGFDADNPLRKMGAVNFYVPSHDYGHVEITHLAILHSMVHA